MSTHIGAAAHFNRANLQICAILLDRHPARVKTTDITDVWDEPLNYIDLVSRIQIEDLLLKYRPSLLFVEHDAAFVRNVATKTVEP